MTHFQRFSADHRLKALQSCRCFFLFGAFREHSTSVIVRRFLSRPSFYLSFPSSCQSFVFCFRIELFTLIRFGGLPGGEAVSRSTIDFRDLPVHSMEKYIEGYCARLDGRRFTSTYLARDTKDVCDVRTGRMHDTAVGAWIKQC